MARRKADTDQLKIRLGEQLRKALETSASTNKRSLNSEIVAKLQESFGKNVIDSLSHAAKMFLDIAVVMLSPPDKDQSPRALTDRERLDARFKSALEPAEEEEPIPDEERLLQWLRERGKRLAVLGREKEARRLHRLTSLLEVVIEAAARDEAKGEQS